MKTYVHLQSQNNKAVKVAQIGNTRIKQESLINPTKHIIAKVAQLVEHNLAPKRLGNETLTLARQN